MIADFCTDAAFILRIVVKLFKVLRWAIPIILIVFISYDLFRVLTSQMDDKAKKDATTKITKRVIYAIIIFFIPTLVNFVLKAVSPSTVETSLNTTSTSWYSCWQKYYNE